MHRCRDKTFCFDLLTENAIIYSRILELFDKSLQNYNIQTRYLTNCSLKPNNELKSGNLMFEILSNWNNSPKSLREEQNLKAFKKILMDNQNQIKKCDIKNCNSCR